MQRLTEAKAWQQLTEYSTIFSKQKIMDLFSQDKDRFNKFSLTLNGLVIDFSKSLVDDRVVSLLLDLAEELGLSEYITDFFKGKELNFTEHRAVLHPVLRAIDSLRDGRLDGVQQEVMATLRHMRDFVEAVHSGSWLGYSGQRITDVVHIGIGGSHLGPAMVVQALSDEKAKLRVHFISNIDPGNLHSVLVNLRPANTLFVIASKTFTTQETLVNASSAREWFLTHLPAGHEDNQALTKHLVAVTAKPERAIQFGVGSDNIFPFWDWVGGRFSLWSAIGISIALALGMEQFESLLAGACAMDEHFKTAPLASNLPVMMGLMGIWRNNFLHADSLAVIPYNYHLQLLPAYLQQLEMESNGKSTNIWGEEVSYTTAPVVWGACGTDSQHSFHQLLMQGTRNLTIDLIVTAKAATDINDQQRLLLANVLAQSRALMQGRDAEAVRAELANLSEPDRRALIPYKVIRGNVSHSVIVMPQLDPYYLGMLLALYEHKVLVQGFIWQINSFDQWGVELGKKLAGEIVDTMIGKGGADLDDSTAHLLKIITF